MTNRYTNLKRMEADAKGLVQWCSALMIACVILRRLPTVWVDGFIAEELLSVCVNGSPCSLFDDTVRVFYGGIKENHGDSNQDSQTPS